MGNFLEQLSSRRQIHRGAGGPDGPKKQPTGAQSRPVIDPAAGFSKIGVHKPTSIENCAANEPLFLAVGCQLSAVGQKGQGYCLRRDQ
jgi:hypothetical protein